MDFSDPSYFWCHLILATSKFQWLLKVQRLLSLTLLSLCGMTFENEAFIHISTQILLWKLATTALRVSAACSGSKGTLYISLKNRCSYFPKFHTFSVSFIKFITSLYNYYIDAVSWALVFICQQALPLWMWSFRLINILHITFA